MKNYIVSSLMCFLVGCGSSSTSGVGGGISTTGSEGSGGGTNAANAANAANEANPDFNKKVEGRKRITDEEFIKGYGENNAWFEASSGKDILDKIRSGHMPNEALLQGNETDAQKQLRSQMQEQFAYDKENNRAAKEERLSVVATTQNTTATNALNTTIQNWKPNVGGSGADAGGNGGAGGADAGSNAPHD